MNRRKQRDLTSIVKAILARAGHEQGERPFLGLDGVGASRTGFVVAPNKASSGVIVYCYERLLCGAQPNDNAAGFAQSLTTFMVKVLGRHAGLYVRRATSSSGGAFVAVEPPTDVEMAKLQAVLWPRRT